MNHDRLRRAARASRSRYFEAWTRDPLGYLLIPHRLELQRHRLWELGPLHGPAPVGLVLVESLRTGSLVATSEDPAATRRVLADEGVRRDELPAVTFELLRTIGSGERYLAGLDHVARSGRTFVVRFAVESAEGISEWRCEFGPGVSRRRIRPMFREAC